MKINIIFRLTALLISFFLIIFIPSIIFAQDTNVAGIWELYAHGVSEGCTEHTPGGLNICGSFKMGDPDIFVSQAGTTISASEVDINSNPFTLNGTVSESLVTFTISGIGITPGIGPATTTYTGILNGNIIVGDFSGLASWSYPDASGNLITETATWSGTFAVTIKSCDFSQQTGIERCFGAQGSGCDGYPYSFDQDKFTCMVSGYMSVGSTLHDRCCIRTNNTGFYCSEGQSLECYDEFWLAIEDFACNRYWFREFGPYYIGNIGDDTTQDFIGTAPAGTHVNPNNQNYCSSGICKTNSKGKRIIYKDLCGRYCICDDTLQ
jgi:hypothetical protein